MSTGNRIYRCGIQGRYLEWLYQFLLISLPGPHPLPPEALAFLVTRKPHG